MILIKIAKIMQTHLNMQKYALKTFKDAFILV